MVKLKFIDKPSRSGSGPRKRKFKPSRYDLTDIDFCTTLVCDKKKIAKSVIEKLNERSVSEQGPEYELVEVLDYLGGSIAVHCNFIARPKNATEAKDKLYFAELMVLSSTYLCRLCWVLGPRGTETGLVCPGCKSTHPGLQHPKDVVYIHSMLDYHATLEQDIRI